MMGGTVSFQLGFGFLRMACWISSVQRRKAARMALSVSGVMRPPVGREVSPESHKLVPAHSCEVAMCTRVRSPDDEHRPFIVAAYRLAGDRVDKCQPPGGDEANLACGLDRFFEPANRSVCRNQHDRADLICAFGSGLLNERCDVAVWRVQPDVAGTFR